ncbi:stellacyanin-like [Selaginella moellendorffii]|uniref:stellacyanin-like n=1 Tax=Selaginella moellendorffii TaxID=88036 RepID=UPI000D1C3F96|nr:stellacyanin-like [Selaginella moellendorffii]|eukprot:XP_024524992.1 stellacyanin-like [Selaginella moellendorffii]
MRNSSPLLLLLVSLWIQIASQLVGAYTTYIVGGDTGWTIPTASNTIVNYTAWASSLTASLGDSLVFRYDPSHTVVQTNNLTTYQSCDATADDETLQIWSSSGSSTVMLTTTGTTYFFCSADDGSHCRDSGMRFAIQVSFGQGLPATPKAAPSPQDGSDDGDDLNFPNFDKFAPPPPPPADSSSASLRCFQLAWVLAAALVLGRLA